MSGWLVNGMLDGRRYLSETSMALVLANTTRDDQAHNPKEAPSSPQHNRW